MLRNALPLLGLAATLLLNSGTAFATTEMSKKEKKGCPVCHDMKKGKATKETPNLNKTGEYYKEKKTLEGAPSAQ
jgi:hypothetical protein